MWEEEEDVEGLLYEKVDNCRSSSQQHGARGQGLVSWLPPSSEDEKGSEEGEEEEEEETPPPARLLRSHPGKRKRGRKPTKKKRAQEAVSESSESSEDDEEIERRAILKAECRAQTNEEIRMKAEKEKEEGKAVTGKKGGVGTKSFKSKK